jgi:hypothetical protein
MSEIEALERQAQEIKNMGYSSKFVCPINKFLEIADKAKRWDAMPDVIKDAAKAVQS